jgi:hypothetical protein
LALLLTPMDVWNDRLRDTLRGYDEGLLRQVAAKLCKPRNQWPIDELIDRCLGTIVNPSVLDRRLKDLDPGSQTVLALIGHSRQPRWHAGNLVEMLVALGEPDGLRPLQTLFEAGLLYPDVPGDGKNRTRLRNFDQWLTQGNSTPLWVYAHPEVTVRALGTGLILPICPSVALEETPAPWRQDSDPARISRDASSRAAPGRTGSLPPRSGSPVYEADGLEWPLRLSVLWQQVATAPLRRTQQRDFFKRDLERLRGDPLLTSPPADHLSDVPDPGLLIVSLAIAEGLLEDQDGVLKANAFPASWQQGLPATLVSLWSVLPHVDSWNAEAGWNPGEQAGNPYPAAYLLSMLLLANLPEGSWARPETVAAWVVDHHPYWKPAGEKNAAAAKAATSACQGLARFLLGVAFHLRLLQATREDGGAWLVRLSPMGRWILGLGELPPAPPPYPQTWLVQPNLEILVYRQGLTAELVARLARFATWKTLSSACTMQLEADTVYRALETGETFATIVQTLERHSMKPLPVPVIDALKTWSNKRDRISVYPAAALFEFADADSLQEALARGLPAVRLTDRLAAVPNESAIDYRHFRLIATRDYCLPLERCVAVEADGVTLSIDQARSDLLLETELQRFAEPVPREDVSRLQYRITPATLASGRQQGLSVQELETWFGQRAGQALSPAVRLLLTAADTTPAQLRRRLVLHVANPEIADGLQQWPATRSLIQDRLGPTTLAVLEDNAAALVERVRGLGMTLETTGSDT